MRNRHFPVWVVDLAAFNLLPFRPMFSQPSLLQVTSQARLGSDVREPQPSVTAGSHHVFQVLGVPDSYTAVP